MGWLIALAVLTVIGMIPLGVSARYDGKADLKVKIGLLSLTIPLGKKKTEEKKDKPSPKEPDPLEEKFREQDQKLQAEEKKAQKKEKKKPADLKIYLPFVKLGIDFLGSLRRKLRIEKLWLNVILAGQDPCALAVNYGRAWAGASALMGNLNQIFEIRDQDLNIECDFTGDKTVFSGRLDLTITVARLLNLAVGYGIRALKEFLIFKKRKGGAVS